MKSKIDWPRGPIWWEEDSCWRVSIPFTWNAAEVRRRCCQRELFPKPIIMGGPAVELWPEAFEGFPNARTDPTFFDPWAILRRVNPLLTRTSIGCRRTCDFCGVGQGKLNGGSFRELPGWPLAPIICDDNILCSSRKHFDNVIGALRNLRECDFSQGIDPSLLTEYHAGRLAELQGAIIRIALDRDNEREVWARGFRLLRAAGVPLRRIRVYTLVGFEDGPAAAWDRCRFIASFRIKPLPMWYHHLKATQLNAVTSEQEALGWTDSERQKLMQRYWQFKHR